MAYIRESYPCEFVVLMELVDELCHCLPIKAVVKLNSESRTYYSKLSYDKI